MARERKTGIDDVLTGLSRSHPKSLAELNRVCLKVLDDKMELTAVAARHLDNFALVTEIDNVPGTGGKTWPKALEFEYNANPEKRLILLLPGKAETEYQESAVYSDAGLNEYIPQILVGQYSVRLAALLRT